MKIAVAWVVALLFLQSPGAPFPESNKFISEFRKTLRSDDELRQDYAFSEKESVTEMDRGGKPKITELKVYEVYPDRGQLYRRLLSVNGVTLSQSELDKEDHDQALKKPESPRDDSKIRDELFKIYDLTIQRRETMEGSPTIMLSFQPRSDYKPQSKLTNFLTHVSGRIWVNEANHQLVRLDAEVVDSVSYGWFLGSLDEGTRLIAERWNVGNDIWMPVRLDIQKNQRVLWKGTKVHEVHEYSDYRKVN
jgi:hypothetical protein